MNPLSKLWQSKNLNLDVVVLHFETFFSDIKEMRDKWFETLISETNEMAELLGVPAEFQKKRPRRKKKMFEYEAEDEVTQDPREKFRIDTFNNVLDTIISGLQWRFDGLKKFSENFGFIYNMTYLSEEELRKHCIDVRNLLTGPDNDCDIDGLELFEELKLLNKIIRKEAEVKKTRVTVAFSLKYIISNDLQNIYPNVYIALRIIATIPITEASCERSFSVLKLIKSYLRSVMSQLRLSALAILSIEKEFLKCLDYSEIIRNLSDRKARKCF